MRGKGKFSIGRGEILGRQGEISAGREMPFSNLNKKLKQGMIGIEKSRRQYRLARIGV